MMKHADGYVLKPVPHPVYGPREINFYKTLETTCDPLLKDLKQYIPQYLGTKTIELDNKGWYRFSKNLFHKINSH